jgi:hypothetical protein
MTGQTSVTPSDAVRFNISPFDMQVWANTLFQETQDDSEISEFEGFSTAEDEDDNAEDREFNVTTPDEALAAVVSADTAPTNAQLGEHQFAKSIEV